MSGIVVRRHSVTSASISLTLVLPPGAPAYKRFELQRQAASSGQWQTVSDHFQTLGPITAGPLPPGSAHRFRARALNPKVSRADADLHLPGTWTPFGSESEAFITMASTAAEKQTTSVCTLS